MFKKSSYETNPLCFSMAGDDIKVGNIPDFPSARWSIITYPPTYFPQYYADLVPVPPRLENAVASRKADYQAGRLAAYTALKIAGAPSLFVESTSQGIPVWPAGWKGSISHSSGRAMAVCIPHSSARIIGVDCEKISSSTANEIIEFITNIEERKILCRCELGYSKSTLVVFSAKESLFKALWPDVGRFFDFSAASLFSLDCSAQTFKLQLNESLHPLWAKGTIISGYFRSDDGYITTLICS